MAKFKVGEIVRIKKKFWKIHDPSEVGENGDMHQYAGRETKICSVHSNEED